MFAASHRFLAFSGASWAPTSVLTIAMIERLGPGALNRALLLLVGLVLFLPTGPVHLSAQSPEAPALRTNGASLLPGDIVRIQIWREEDLSGEFQVNESGIVVLPLLGDRSVLGISPDSLRDQLVEEYDGFLVNPSVNVTLLRRVTVMGEVRVPGLYPVDATVSVAQLIAIAQGVTSEGDVNRIRLIRGGQTVNTNLAGTMAITEAGIRSGDQIMIGKRSWISRNLSSLAWIMSIATNLVVLSR